MNDNAELQQLTIRTSAAFMAIDMLSKILEKHGIISRADLADELIELVDGRRQEILHIPTGQIEQFRKALDVVGNFASNELRAQ